jgi:hypothetical protein
VTSDSKGGKWSATGAAGNEELGRDPEASDRDRLPGRGGEARREQAGERIASRVGHERAERGVRAGVHEARGGAGAT